MWSEAAISAGTHSYIRTTRRVGDFNEQNWGISVGAINEGLRRSCEETARGKPSSALEYRTIIHSEVGLRGHATLGCG